MRGDYEKQRTAALLGRIGHSVILRHVTLLSGPNPSINPPSYSGLAVDGLQAATATTLNLKASAISGRLIAGDKFTIAGDGNVYTVTGQIVASLNKLAAVPIAPALAKNAADNAVVTPVFASDVILSARVQMYPQSMVNGTTIQQSDLQVLVPALGLPFIPSTTDKIIIDGTVRSINHVAPNYSGDQVIFYNLQAR